VVHPEKYGTIATTEAFPLGFVHVWMRTAVLFFVTASLFGLTMRYLFIGEIPFLSYKNILHAHSHIALMGWAFMFLSGGLMWLFIPTTTKLNHYRWLFGFNMLSGVGMVLSFPIQGYGSVSITFSTLHLLCSYGFAYLFLSDLSKVESTGATQFAKWGVYWMVFSSIGLWAIAPVSILLGKLHPLYFMCVQFFLHFQLNGWLTFAVLAIFTSHVQKNLPEFKVSVSGFWLLQLSLLLTYFLSVTWSTPIPALFYINSVGVLIQAVAIFLLFKPVVASSFFTFKSTNWQQWLLTAGIGCLLIKVIIQMAVALPVVATISYTIKNFVIGFIHLVVIGSVTLSGAGILLQNSLLPSNERSKKGWLLLLTAFLLTEIVLLGQGLLLWLSLGFIPNYHTILFAVSALFPIALVIIASGFWNSSASVSLNPKPNH